MLLTHERTEKGKRIRKRKARTIEPKASDRLGTARAAEYARRNALRPRDKRTRSDRAQDRKGRKQVRKVRKWTRNILDDEIKKQQAAF